MIARTALISCRGSSHALPATNNLRNLSKLRNFNSLDLLISRAPPQCLDHASRMRQHRERRRAGMRCLTIELRETEIDALIRKGFLKAQTRNDKSEIAEAIYAYFDRELA